MGGNGTLSIAGVPQHNGADMARAIQTGIVPGAQGVIAGQRPLDMPGMHIIMPIQMGRWLEVKGIMEVVYFTRCDVLKFVWF